ncbi:hypothetical protein CYMTET_11122 [Cymbomonas tetramitiformis]|uniref:Uncharacterized protein n=1 Tax=Cymbomonas tetramitiformis TaxID=36881 RepID=A0AAE0GN24_9CHLO|nr:hypothetical protein CYMTET_11122 [Cymbomonas tetramitiformis]
MASRSSQQYSRGRSFGRDNGRKATSKRGTASGISFESQNDREYKRPKHGAEPGTFGILKVRLEKVVSRITPLLRAVVEEQAEAVSQLLCTGVCLEARDANGNTALFWAVMHGDLVITLELLQSGANPTSATQDNWSVLHQALRDNHGEMACLLIEYGANEDAKGNEARDDDGRTALYVASAGGKNGIVKLLLDNGADAQARDNKGGTPLKAAAAGGHRDVVESLLEAGASHDWSDLLWEAAAGQHVEVVEVILEKTKDNDGAEECVAMLEEAVDHGRADVVKCLIRASIEQIYAHRFDIIRGIIVSAAASGQVELVQHFVSYAGTRYSRHSLYLILDRAFVEAAHHKQREVVQFLGNASTYQRPDYQERENVGSWVLMKLAERPVS